MVSAKESASITAEKALQLKVIDLIATNMSDLLQKLNGRVVDGEDAQHGWRRGFGDQDVGLGTHLSKTLATRSDVRSHAHRDLWNHRS